MKPTATAAPHAISASFPALRRLAMMAAAAFAMFATPVAAQPANLAKDFPLPALLGNFIKGELTDYEAKKKGMGFAVDYKDKDGAAKVYVYDKGHKAIPNGPDNTLVGAEYERDKLEIFNIQKEGKYAGVELKRTFEIKNAAGKLVFNCVALQLTRKDKDKDKGPVDSFLCLTGMTNKFVKVRISVRQAPNSNETAERFLNELVAALPGAK